MLGHRYQSQHSLLVAAQIRGEYFHLPYRYGHRFTASYYEIAQPVAKAAGGRTPPYIWRCCQFEILSYFSTTSSISSFDDYPAGKIY
jgi:hypothetical protein